MRHRNTLRLTLLPVILLICFASEVRSQQEPSFSQSMFYGLTFNPGVAGNENAVCVTGANRMQWTGFGKEDGKDVAPTTFFVSGSLPIKILRGGVGLVVIQDELGHEKTTAVRFGYAYQRNMGFGKLGIGAQVEFNNRFIDFSRLRPAGEDPLLNQLGSEESDMLIDFSLGLFYRVPGSYFVGVSGLHLVQSKGKPLIDVDGSGLSMKLDRTFFVTGGYEFTFAGNPDFQLIPSAILQSNLSTLKLDVNAMVKFKEVVWAGAGYRLNESVIIFLGLQYKDIKLGYSYDINVNKLALPIFGGTHEIMLNYCFKLDIDKGRSSYKNTRFL